jgi:hypothetical protein
MDEDTAYVLYDIIEFASEGTWPQLKKYLKEKGHTVDQLHQAGEDVVDSIGYENPLDRGNFE